MGLIAHYRLNGDGNDSIGGLNGSPSNVTWLPGKIGTAGKFNGVDANMLVTDERLNLRVALSLSCWLRVDAIPSWKRVIQRGPHTNYQLDMAPRSSNTQFALRSAVYNDAGEYVWTYSHNIDIGSFVHVAMVIGDGFNRLYVDGQLAGEKPWNDLISDQPLSEFCIGSDPRGVSTTFFDGLIQDVRVYDHALSPREVRDLSLGLMSRYRLYGDTTDAAGTGLISIGSGAFVDSDIGIVADVVGTRVNIALEHVPLNLKGETIVFREKCDFLRSDALGGGFTNHIIQWGKYYGDNSGGFGLQSGNFSYYLRGPSSSGWTNSGSIAAAAQRYDLGGWIDYAVVFGEDDTISLYMDGDRVSHFPLSVPYTGLNSEGVRFGSNMLAKVSDVRIYATALTAAQVKELYQQRASIDNVGSVHTPLILQSPRARYIRDWTNGSTSNHGNHWLEVRAVYAGENISLGKPVTAISGGTRLSKVTDGDTSNSGYAYTTHGIPAWVQVDLEEVREIDEVQVWHYNADGRTYYDTKTEISEDGINWTTIFDSSVSGTYQETTAGITHQAKALGPVGITHQGLRLPGASEVGVTRGLVAWYPLIGDTLDYAGTNHAVNNGAVATAEGYEFGEGDHMDLRGSKLPAVFSVSMVINTSTVGVVSEVNDYRNVLNAGGNFVLIETDSTVSFRVPGVSSGNFRSTLPINLGSETHITVVYDQSSRKTYINGEPAGEVSEVSGTPSTTDLRVSPASGDHEYVGTLRDVRIHNVALTPEEVAIQAKLALSHNHRTAFTQNCMYTRGQIKEVIA